jgi:hypothetical protein
MALFLIAPMIAVSIAPPAPGDPCTYAQLILRIKALWG